MISLNNENEVSSLFEREIAPQLDDFEQQRNEIVAATSKLWRKNLLVWVLPATLSVFAGSYYLFHLGVFATVLTSAIAAVFFVVIAYTSANGPAKEYESQIRDRFMALACEAIGDLTYHHSGSMFTLTGFRECRLIPEHKEANLENELNGLHRGYKFSMVEAMLVKEDTDFDPDGSTTTQRETVFEGILIKLDSPVTFHGTVLITRERGKFLNTLAGVFETGRRVKIPDTEFEEIYAVYATDIKNAAVLFTPSMINLLKQLPEMIEAEIQLAFQHGNILIAAKNAKPFLNRFSVKMDTVHYQQFFEDVVRECTLAINLLDEFEQANEHTSASQTCEIPNQTLVT